LLRGQIAALQGSSTEAQPDADAEVSDVDAVAVDRSGPT
jgi:hypothetical protein